jgi:type IV pilus assembly protein PilE
MHLQRSAQSPAFSPRRRGLTFIELLVVVAIAGILAAIAYPTYITQIQRTRRGDAQAVLIQNAQRMERFFSENGSYLDSGGNAPQIITRAPIDPGYPTSYAIQFATDFPTATTFRIEAIPQGPQVGTGRLDIDETGRRRWDSDNDGVYQPSENTWAPH